MEKTEYVVKNGSTGINAGNNTVNETLTLVPPTYTHNLTINLISDEAVETHLVRDSPIDFTTSLGTVTHSTIEQTYTYTWTSTIETESVTYDINISGRGHKDPAATIANVGPTSVIE